MQPKRNPHIFITNHMHYVSGATHPSAILHVSSTYPAIPKSTKYLESSLNEINCHVHAQSGWIGWCISTHPANYRPSTMHGSSHLHVSITYPTIVRSGKRLEHDLDEIKLSARMAVQRRFVLPVNQKRVFLGSKCSNSLCTCLPMLHNV
jgi:hypothetical protein